MKMKRANKHVKNSLPLPLSTGKQFVNSGGGRWATERLAAAVKGGQHMSPEVLRTLDTLSKDEWIHLDAELIEEAKIRLVGVADLMSMGLTLPVPNAMGKTVVQYETLTDMDPAIISLDGKARSNDDRQEYDLHGIPLPIIHKDFDLNLRVLEASRTRGEALDTTQIRTAGRLVAETLERVLFQGGPIFGGLPIYGYMTHPNRNIVGFGPGGNWLAGAKTGEQILADVLMMIAAAHARRMYGPFMVYLPPTYALRIAADFKAASDKSVLQRIKEIDGILGVKTADQLPTNNVVLVQMTKDVTCLVNGENLQTIQWDVEGGFIIKFKAFCIQIPLIRADAQGRSGVVHMS
jgi:uncharacterized linocin/CFP29 family protein